MKKCKYFLWRKITNEIYNSNSASSLFESENAKPTDRDEGQERTSLTDRSVLAVRDCLNVRL